MGQGYALRWEVETFYRQGKSRLELDQLKRLRKKVRVKVVVLCALIRASVAMQARCHARISGAGYDEDVRLNPELWTLVNTIMAGVVGVHCPLPCKRVVEVMCVQREGSGAPERPCRCLDELLIGHVERLMGPQMVGVQELDPCRGPLGQYHGVKRALVRAA